MTTLRFVHSPFTGPAAWSSVATVMQDRGWTVCMPSLEGAFDGREPYMQRLAEAVWAGAARNEPSVLIAHSGAGALMPAAVAAAPSPVAAVILVDALVPQPGTSWRSEAPAELIERLDTFTDCGLLPEWHRWFSARLLREILAGDTMREDFIESLPRVPASYLDEAVPETPAWPPRKGAYLQLSDAYKEDAQRASGLAWLVRALPLDHLAVLTRPDEVGEALQLLIEALGIER